MDEIIRIIIIAVVSIALIIAIFIFVKSIIKKRETTKMYSDIEAIFEEYKAKDPENIKYEKFEKNSKNKDSVSYAYDYVLESSKYCYFIKIVPNIDNQEICVNNSVKWQLRKSFNDESLRFVEGIEELMRLELPKIPKKRTKKLYIIYPNARSLLKYINECEMEFVHPTTDVYGANIITFVNLNEHKELIKI